MAGCHPSDLEAWRKCGDNQVAGEGVPKVSAPPWCSLPGGPELSPGELRGTTSRARGGAKSPRIWAKVTLQLGRQLKLDRVPNSGEGGKGREPFLVRRLAGWAGGPSRGQQKKGHSVGTRELQLAEEIIVVLYGLSSSLSPRARVSRQFLGTRRFP